MIEQTELVITQWDYHPPAGPVVDKDIQGFTSLDVMQKRASTKKGLACRLTASFMYQNKSILDVVGVHSYVINFEDAIDKNELLKMFRNSFSEFQQKFELRKLNTALHNSSLRPLDESILELDAILPLLL